MRAGRTTAFVPAAVILLLTVAAVWAQEDQPHSRAQNLTCMTCHLSHEVFGNQIGSTAGNANLCLSCHQTGGLASKAALAEHQQAKLGPDAAAQPLPTGTSHRWDAGVSGRVESLSGVAETAIEPAGSYTGRYAASYTITITSSGNVGTARFNWAGTGPGTGTGVDLLTGSAIPLEQGLTISFRDVPPVATFLVGDQWRLLVRPGLKAPSNPDLQRTMTDGKVVCSTCHNAHSQAQEDRKSVV